jgi:IPT/TIG domain
VTSPPPLTATSPAQATGTVDVTVTTAGGTSATSKADQFKVVPTVLGLSPNAGSKLGGTTVTITGAGFALGTTATKFKFGVTLSKSVNCRSTTECTAVAPAHAAGTVDVKATVNKVSSAKTAPADQFTYD